MLSVQSPDILIVKRIWTSYVEFTLYKLIVIIKFRWTVTSQDRSSTPPQCYTIHNTNSELVLLGLTDSLMGDRGEVYEQFKEQLGRSPEGWYETGLPWKGNHPLAN